MVDRDGTTITPAMLDAAITTVSNYVKYASCMESLHIMASVAMPNVPAWITRYSVALVWTKRK